VHCAFFLREHSRLELARKLARHAEEGDDVEALLDLLEKNNWLSQERFSESLIHRRAARYGNSRIVAELQSHGVNGEALQELKSTWLTPNWNARRRSGSASLAPSPPIPWSE
jgi:regulatory protein